MATHIPKVMIIGLGFMGTNHLNNLKSLEKEGRVHVVSLVDTDSERLKNQSIASYTSFEEAFKKTNPDIVCICTNTKTHKAVLDKLLDMTLSDSQQVGIFNEKPLTANSKDATEIIQRLQKRGYGSSNPITCGYLFRQSPAFHHAIEVINKYDLKIKTIASIWQKDREKKGPPRPSEGVITDELTHAVDANLAFLKALGYNTDIVKILEASKKRQSQVGKQIVDQKQQEKLYADEPEKLDPIAVATYVLEVDGITITGSSSFIDDPQRREILIECSGDTTILMKFDVNGGDSIEIVTKNEKTEKIYPKVNKLLLGWEAFLKYSETGKRPITIPTMQEMLFDIQLTEALSKIETFPHILKQ